MIKQGRCSPAIGSVITSAQTISRFAMAILDKLEINHVVFDADVSHDGVVDEDCTILQTFSFDDMELRAQDRRRLRRRLQLGMCVLGALALALAGTWADVAHCTEELLFSWVLLLLLLGGLCNWFRSHFPGENECFDDCRVALTPQGIRVERVKNSNLSYRQIDGNAAVEKAVPQLHVTQLYLFSEIEDIKLAPPPKNPFFRKEPRIILTCRGSREIVLRESGALKEPQGFVQACRQALERRNTRTPTDNVQLVEAKPSARCPSEVQLATAEVIQTDAELVQTDTDLVASKCVNAV